MTEPTSGEWKVAKGSDDLPIGIVAENDRLLADVLWDDDMLEDYPPEAEAWANARLMVKAKEMKALLEEWVAGVDYVPEDGPGYCELCGVSLGVKHYSYCWPHRVQALLAEMEGE